MGGGPQGSFFGLRLFAILFSDLENGMQCTLNEFVDGTKLSGAANTTEGRNAVQRDLAGLKSRPTWT